MSNELTVVQQQTLTPSIWQMINEIAPAIVASKMFNVREEQAKMIMLKGHELGFGFTTSFEFINVIDGKPGLNAKGLRAKILSSPVFAGMKITDEQDKCTVWMKRTNGFEYEISFTMDEAKQAGLVKPNSGWSKYPANMLRARATAFCATVVFPDVLGGMLTTEELGSYDDFDWSQNGDNFVEGQSVVVTTDPEPEPESVYPNYGWDLPKLMSEVSTDDILAVNDNTFPTLPNEINQVIYQLIQIGKMADPLGEVATVE